MAKNLIFQKIAYKKKIRIFRRKSGFVTFLHLEQANLLKKKLEKSNDGKYGNFCDRQTDGPGYIGPKIPTKTIENNLLKSQTVFNYFE